jgi:hypothetical protein
MVEGSIAKALEIGIVQLHDGMDLEEVLALFPEFTGELRAPLEGAQAACWLAISAVVPPEVQPESRERFVLAVGTSRLAQQGRRRQRSSLASPAGRRISGRSSARKVLGILVVLFALFLSLAVAVTISARALPGEPLYPFKLAVERVQLRLQQDPVRLLELEQAFDRRRNQETQILGEQIQAAEPLALLPVQWVGLLTEIQPETWKVQEMNVRLLPETQLVGRLDPGYVVLVDGQLQADGALSADRIALRQFQVRGRLERLSAVQGIVEGVPFNITENTVIEGGAAPGSQVYVILLKTRTGELEARLIQMEQPAP